MFDFHRTLFYDRLQLHSRPTSTLTSDTPGRLTRISTQLTGTRRPSPITGKTNNCGVTARLINPSARTAKEETYSLSKSHASKPCQVPQIGEMKGIARKTFIGWLRTAIASMLATTLNIVKLSHALMCRSGLTAEDPVVGSSETK